MARSKQVQLALIKQFLSTLPADKTFDIQNHYRDVFYKQNWHRIGNGGYSTVFEHADYPNYVVKLSCQDPAYQKYAEICMRFYTKHKHLPKIYYKMMVDKEFVFYVIEKLVPNVKYKTVDLVRDALFNLKDIIRSKKPTPRIKKCRVDLDKTLKTLGPTMAKSIRKIAPVLKKSSIDLHGANMMRRVVRGKETLIITDPVVP